MRIDVLRLVSQVRRRHVFWLLVMLSLSTYSTVLFIHKSALRSKWVTVPIETQHNISEEKETSDDSLVTRRHRAVLFTDASILDANYTTILNHPPPYLLPGFPNPCFIVNISNKHSLHCLPKVYVLTPVKSGSTQLKGDLMAHPDLVFSSEHNVLISLLINGTLKNVTKAVNKALLMGEHLNPIDIIRPIHLRLSVDSYPAGLHMSDPWNGNYDTRVYNLPRILHHLNPNTLFLITLRNPVTRTLSDYLYLSSTHAYNRTISADDFHQQVTEGITSWQRCLLRYTERKCIFSYLFGNWTDCGLITVGNGRQPWCPGTSAASRLRLSIYSLYLKDFLIYFPLENFLFLRAEDYWGNRKNVVQTQIYPFLGVDRCGKLCLQNLNNNSREAKVRNKYRGKQIKPLRKTLDLLHYFYRPYNNILARILKNPTIFWN